MTTQTVTALTLVSNLFNAIDVHQSNVDALSVSYMTREQALKAFKDAGYTRVQDGRTKGAPKKGEVPNNEELKSFFNGRFLKHCNEFYLSRCDRAVSEGKEKPEFTAPSEAQLSANLKQQLACLNYYLKTGTFTTNVGRDKFKNEQLETFRVIDILEKKAKAEKAKAEKAKKELEALAKKQAEAEAKALAEAEANALAEAEAKALAEAEAKALAEVINNPSTANKRALAKAKAEADALAKAKAEADALAKADADKLKADADALVKQVQAEALAKVKAEAEAKKAEAEAKRLKAEADAKAKVKAKPQDDKQVLDNIYKSAINNLTEKQIEELINKLTMFLDIG